MVKKKQTKAEKEIEEFAVRSRMYSKRTIKQVIKMGDLLAEQMRQNTYFISKRKSE